MRRIPNRTYLNTNCFAIDKKVRRTSRGRDQKPNQPITNNWGRKESENQSGAQKTTGGRAERERKREKEREREREREPNGDLLCDAVGPAVWLACRWAISFL